MFVRAWIDSLSNTGADNFFVLFFVLLLFVFTTYQGIGASLLGANADINNSGLAINNLLPEVSSNDHTLIVFHIINLMDKHALWLTGLLAVGLIAAVD